MTNLTVRHAEGPRHVDEDRSSTEEPVVQKPLDLLGCPGHDPEDVSLIHRRVVSEALGNATDLDTLPDDSLGSEVEVGTPPDPIYTYRDLVDERR